MAVNRILPNYSGGCAKKATLTHYILICNIYIMYYMNKKHLSYMSPPILNMSGNFWCEDHGPHHGLMFCSFAGIFVTAVPGKRLANDLNQPHNKMLCP